MDTADRLRQGDRDDRGALSMQALVGFTGWSLTVMLDQIRFTRAMLDLDALRPSYLAFARDVTGGDERVGRLVNHVLRHGELARGDAQMVLRTSERTAPTALRRAQDAGFLASVGPKTPVRIAFRINYRERRFPNLFAEGPIEAPAPPTAPPHTG